MDGAPKKDFETLPTLEPESHDLSVTVQVQRDENYDHLHKALSELTPEHRQAIAERSGRWRDGRAQTCGGRG